MLQEELPYGVGGGKNNEQLIKRQVKRSMYQAAFEMQLPFVDTWTRPAGFEIAGESSQDLRQKPIFQ